MESAENISPVQSAPEKKNSGELLSHYIESRILSLPIDPVEEIDPEMFSDLTPREKVDSLYEAVTAYFQTAQAIREQRTTNPEQETEPINPYLVAKIRYLWEDKAVQELATSTYSEARMDTQLFRLSELGKKWHTINDDIAKKQASYQAENQKLFLQKIARPDNILAAREKAKSLAKSLLKRESERDAVIHLTDLPKLRENTDIAAQIMHEQLASYHEQLSQGFVWLPSRERLQHEIVAGLQNGRWPLLIGETGTGKSELADAAAVELTGMQPLHIACNERTNERNFIADTAIDPESGGTYEEYGSFMQAATGFTDSRQTEPESTTGRIVRLDESGRMGPQGYSVIKELRQKKPASVSERELFKRGGTIDVDKTLRGKPVLPGFSSIWTTNPPGTRYVDRSEPDEALRRELSYITVDYPPMTETEPELYEFMLAALMDKKGHIPVAKEELSPGYRVLTDPSELAGELLPDGLEIQSKEEILHDPTDTKHGYLYRLAFAVRSLQDAFNYGNISEIPETALRYTIDDENKTTVVKLGGDPLTLSTMTITLGEITSWMKGFYDRQLKDIPEYQVASFTEWIQVKLQNYLNQSDNEDREKIRALFEHFHLFDQALDIKDAKPVTPKEIGYLSPRVPRPVSVKETAPPMQEPEAITEEVEKQPEINQDVEVMLEDGTTVLVTPRNLTIHPRTIS